MIGTYHEYWDVGKRFDWRVFGESELAGLGG
jgi:hypothetical protein